jgi:hypothetical protein
MIIEERPLLDGWWVTLKLSFKHFTKEAVNAQNIVYMSVDNPSKVWFNRICDWYMS